MKVRQFFERLRIYPDWDKDLLIENKETKTLEDIKDIVCDERNGNLIIEKCKRLKKKQSLEDFQPIRIVLQDKDNHGALIGVLEVKDIESKSPADTFEKIDKMFGAYKYSKENLDEDWTVEDFVEYLKKFNSSTFTVSYDDDPWAMVL